MEQRTELAVNANRAPGGRWPRVINFQTSNYVRKTMSTGAGTIIAMNLPARPLTIAAIQAHATPGDIPTNTATAARLATTAADHGATLAVLPELFLPAYHPPAIRADPTTYLTADDPRLDPLRTTATTHHINIITGTAYRHPDGRRTCTALLITTDGTTTPAYDKQNLWGPDEHDLFTPGDHGTTLTVDTWHLALGICYDGCFPEHARAAATDGAHAYLTPSGYLQGSQHRRDLYYRARALDNTIYVVFANLIGGEPPWHFNGGAAIYDPQGRTLAKADDTTETVLVATLDPTELATTRTAHTMLADHPTAAGKPRHTITIN